MPTIFVFLKTISGKTPFSFYDEGEKITGRGVCFGTTIEKGRHKVNIPVLIVRK